MSLGRKNAEFGSMVIPSLANTKPYFEEACAMRIADESVIVRPRPAARRSSVLRHRKIERLRCPPLGVCVSESVRDEGGTKANIGK